MVTECQMSVEEDFTYFMHLTQPRVLVALAAAYGPGAANDASAEAFAYAWQHWDRVGVMENPGGYVYRVAGQQAKPYITVPMLATGSQGSPRRAGESDLCLSSASV